MTENSLDQRLADLGIPAAAKALSTAEVSDALDALRLPGSVLGLGHMAGQPRLFGTAYTVRYVPVDLADPGTVGDYLDDTPAGAVVVLDNGGRQDCTVWGGILSRLAQHRGIAGTVVNGVCRDTSEADAVGYPLYASGRFMRTGKDRVQVQAVGEPVSLGDVRVEPGDFLVGDKDGIVVVPKARAAEVFHKALALEAAERRIVEATLAGMTLCEARRSAAYHTLQRPARSSEAME
ncbi:MAG: RraA family protein [Burkholderiales bacterium]|nr:RraA family protein [Burkholderiales bacterium]